MNPLHSIRNLLQEGSYHVNFKRDERARLRLEETERRLSDLIQYQAGLVHDLLLRDRRPERLTDAGYRVYSQFDEDGIIQHLIRSVPIENDLFIEIGIEDYRESNTRYLLQKDDWRGVLIDAVGDAPAFLHESGLYGWHDVTFMQSYVTRENVDSLLGPYGGDIGLLSIDIDGMDYWVWDALESVSPRILVVEYQTNFGPDKPIVVPYRADFDRTKHHFTNLCYGASITALAQLGLRKGYALVGTSRGPNAFFVRRELLGSLRELAPAEAYRELRLRDSRGPDYENTYIAGVANRRRAMANGIVLDLSDGREKTVAEALDL